MPPSVFELGNERKLGQIEDCANIAICLACEAAWAYIGFGGRVAGAAAKGVLNSKVGKETLERLQNSEAAQKAGATSAMYVTLRLPLEIKDLFREWLADARKYRDLAGAAERHSFDQTVV